MANPWNSDTPYDYSTSWVAATNYVRTLNARFTGDADKHWYIYSVEKYLCVGDTRQKSVLILGSSEGWMERALREAGFEGRIVASDIADNALSRAREKIEAMGLTGIEHVQADLNADTFPAGSFDAIIAEGVLHHIENIDFCIDGIKAALKPGGLLIGSEFVGAYRFQFPEAQVRWINAALIAIPAKYRPLTKEANHDLPPTVEAISKVHYVPPTVDEMMAFDPSEAVAGHLLIASIERHFTAIENKGGGGALVMNLAGHFPFAQTNVDPDCAAWLDLIAQMEKNLYEQDIVPSDLVFFVYRVN